jgi:hypothetical protein
MPVTAPPTAITPIDAHATVVRDMLRTAFPQLLCAQMFGRQT